MNTIQRAAAIRHIVYRDLLGLLPLASVRQTVQFIANLALVRNHDYAPNKAKPERDRIETATKLCLLRLKVSPDINCISDGANGRGIPKSEIERTIVEKHGDGLADIAGFYFDRRWRLNLPEGCALHGYRNREGFYTGILCQPLSQINRYFLLSAAAFGGAKALRLEPSDRIYFEQWNRPAEPKHNLTAPANQADLTGFRFNGRRFVEVNS